MRAATSSLLALAVLLSAPQRADAEGGTAGDGIEGPYPLDVLSREVPARGPVACPKVEFALYEGEVVRYRHPAKVFEGFRERLRKFEEVVVEVATEVYGRPPSRVVHLGTYACRRIGGYPTWMSEHGLGNAIDIEGFDFAALPRGEQAAPSLPPSLRGAFQVRVERHWPAERGEGAIHGRFLRTVAQTLVARRDIFRVLLGPGYPGHRTHFHFDMGPFRMVEGF